MTNSRIFAAFAAIALTAQTASAQQPNASAAAFGMGGNYTANAQGYDAVAWNPANLGLASAPRFSLNILSSGGTTGLGPVSLSDISAASKLDGPIPSSTKEAWLQKIGTGTQRGSGDASLSLVALSAGRIGFQLGVSGYGVANLNQDAAEAILFGNAGRTGTAKDLKFAGSNARGGAFTTGALSFALPLSWKPTGSADEQFSLGVTGKFVSGAGVLRAQDNGTLITSNNVSVQFPIIYSPEAGSNGTGIGVDLGAAWSAGRLSLGATAQNVVNSFKWETTKLRSKAGSATFDGNVSSSNFDDMPYLSAPASLRQAIEDEKFEPVVAGGLAYRYPSLTLTVDARQRIGEGIDIGPKMHVGTGAEYRGIGFLPLRAGVAAVTGGWQAGAGVGLKLGAFELGVAASTRTRDNSTENGAMVSLISIR
jgi:hypothetical protein